MSPVDWTLADSWDTGKLFVVGGLALAGVVIYKLLDVIGDITKTRMRELTKRELTAYVAEGSITPETAERLMAAKVADTSGEAWAEHVATLVQSGAIDASEAERLIKSGPGNSPQPAGAQAKPA